MPHVPAHTPSPADGADPASTAVRVSEIVAAAEQAAADLRIDTERRAAERIAEADRAAAMRAQAADDEATELRDEAIQQAQETRDQAAAKAREVIDEARAAARDVLRDGEQISGHLDELGAALRVNAERLLRDIRLAHAELTSRLDQADPNLREGRGFEPSVSRVERRDELDVPEFIPRNLR
ncbi:MAG: hypothetical protein ACR2LK_10600 [Solirubrobacteraceae bacterium]